MDMQVIGLCFAAVVFMFSFTFGVLILSGKFDGQLLKSAQKKGVPIDVNRNRRILGCTLIFDSIVIPLVLAFVFGLI